MGFISHSCCICRGDTEMIRLEDFNKAVEFIQKKAKECDIEIVQIGSSAEIINFYGETHGCGTPIYAEINTWTGAIMLGRPLVEEDSFFRICTDGTVVQISAGEYDGYDDEDEW